LGLEGVTYGKIFGIIACFLGAVCVGLNDQEEEADSTQKYTAAGDLVAMCGAVCYGLYTTVLKYQVGRLEFFCIMCVCVLCIRSFNFPCDQPRTTRSLFYCLLMKYQIPDDDGIPMQLMLGYVGLINIVCLAPVLILLVCIKLQYVSTNEINC
jgi:drug/metabolite transporter (DMT)-like permease